MQFYSRFVKTFTVKYGVLELRKAASLNYASSLIFYIVYCMKLQATDRLNFFPPYFSVTCSSFKVALIPSTCV